MICLILYAANANSYGDLPTNDYVLLLWHRPKYGMVFYIC